MQTTVLIVFFKYKTKIAETVDIMSTYSIIKVHSARQLLALK